MSGEAVQASTVIRKRESGMPLRSKPTIQWGVPTNVLRLVIVLVSWAATPKSASFTSPLSAGRLLVRAGGGVVLQNAFRRFYGSGFVRQGCAPVRRILLHFMSRCTLLFVCR